MTPRARRDSSGSPRYAFANWLFLRLLGVVYLFAFWSLAQQVQLLIGHDGILPASEYLSEARVWADASGIGWDRYRLLPTVFWLGTSDRFLQIVPVAGAILALFQMAGVGSIVVLPAMWLLYLSLNVVGRDFLSFQWDALLLEAGVVAIALAPIRWWHRVDDRQDPPPAARWLVWWLLFRLMFGSGFVKLASGDPSWHNLTALAFHYETQPLPTPVGWFAAQLPRWVQQVSTALTLAIELVAPWLIVAGVRPRRIAALLFIGLQALIALTGNYAFFNLLSAALSVTLLDDNVFQRLVSPVVSPRRLTLVEQGVAVVLALVLIPLSLIVFTRQLGVVGEARFIQPLVEVVDPLRSVNTYGLFAVMTTTRPEIVVEGSMDGTNWRAYEFRYKPGSLERAPRWVAPFQPRVDWQMWFAALGRFESEAWFQPFLRRLLTGSKPVLRMFEYDPFQGRPPRFVRGSLYRYRFAPRGDKAWWVRERIGDYSPPLTLKPDTLGSATDAALAIPRS